MIATVDGRPLVNLRLMRAHLTASAVFFAVSLLGGLAYAFQFNNLYPFEGIEWLSPGRVRMVHTNMAAYGFIANAFIGGILFAIPRLTRRPILSDPLGWLIFAAWQLVMVLTIAGQLTGHGQGIEWGETPTFVDPLVLVGLILLVVNMATPIFQSEEPGLYVSLWYFLAAFAWTGLVYFMGNYLPQYWVPGTAGAAITGLFIHDLVGLFVTPLGWGLMYFFVPLLLRKPIWSHALSLITSPPPTSRSSIPCAAQNPGLRSARPAAARLPTRSSFDSAGRSYGGCGSSPTTRIRPSYPSARSTSAQRAPARPAPTIRMSVCSTVIGRRCRCRRGR